MAMLQVSPINLCICTETNMLQFVIMSKNVFKELY